MAFNLEEWNKLSDAECERRYKQRFRDEERGKTLAVIVAFVLLVWLIIAVFRASAETTVVEPGPSCADRHMKREFDNLQTLQLRANRSLPHWGIPHEEKALTEKTP
jgi:hypothetical protein